MMKINEVAKLTGITVRTLHYYDEIGLLKPNQTSEAGYRLYDDESLEILQQILFFKELDFSLNTIKHIIRNPSFNKKNALEKHSELLKKKRERIDRLIRLVENTIRGDKDMSFSEFDMTEIESTKQKYAEEVRERWGNTDAYAESEKKTSKYSKEQWQKISEESSNLFKAFAENKEKAADSIEAQQLVERWKGYITEYFYTCTDEILQGLGLMYINDERFRKNIDKNGEGTAEFIAKAIEIYCRK